MEFPMAFLELTCLLMFITVSYALVRDNNHLELNRSSFPEKFIFGTASSAYQTEGAASEAGRGPSMCDTFTHKHPVSYALVRDNNHLELNRGSFPERFIFGTASSAYQTEGAASEDGRGPSICDTFTHKHPERIADGSNGDVAIDSYHRFKGDVNIMKNMSLDAYRFSISWSRILPNGSLSGGINWEGINHYNKFIDELISNGLQPFVTLFHFDTPQGLEDKYGSFLSSNIVEDFRDYAGICFSKFGDRVKHWITFNEISSFSIGGFNFRDNPDVDLGRAPYIVGHNQLLAHAAAVKLYRDRFKPRQQGKIGTTIATKWMVPYSNTKSDINAVERALDFMFGWVMNPLTRGNYPFNMRRLVGSRLPKFTAEQSKMLRGSFDFIGLNYYTASYVHSLPVYNGTNKTYFTDMCINQTALRHGIPIGPLVGSSWIYNYPKGIRDLLLYTKGKYNNPVIYITENGVDEVNNGTLSLEESLEDDMRIDFHNQHLYHVQSAIRKGVDVRGYFVWSLLDNFEWISGFTIRFGLNYVAHDDNLKRYPKKSALWFTKFLRR